MPAFIAIATECFAGLRRMMSGRAGEAPDAVWLRAEELVLWYGLEADGEAARRRLRAERSGDVAEAALWGRVFAHLNRRKRALDERVSRRATGAVEIGQCVVFDRLVAVVRGLFEIANEEADENALHNTCAAAWQLTDICPPTPQLRRAVEHLVAAVTAVDRLRGAVSLKDDYPVEVEIAAMRLIELKWWAMRNGR